MADQPRIRLTDIMAVHPVEFLGVRPENGPEGTFKMGQIMDRVNGRGSQTTLLTTFDAIHSGVIVNIRCYPGIQVRDSMHHWTDPYPKPILERHPPKNIKPGESEPKVYGRVRDASFIQLVDDQQLKDDWKNPVARGNPGSGYAKVRAGITDPDAIEQLLDKRFLTVSQGSDTPNMFCSACGSDWAVKGGRCDHLPGKSYELQDSKGSGTMFFITGLLLFDHLAKCNTPGQPYSTVTACELIDQQLVDSYFNNGELLQTRMSSVVLIDSQSGVTEFLLGEQADTQQDIIDWSAEEWAEVYILTALADAGRLKDGALDESLPRINRFRASDRKLKFGEPRYRIGPEGCVPICDMATAKALIQVVDKVRGVDPTRLRREAANCVGKLVPLSGGSTMPDTSAQKTEWAAIVKLADGLLEKDEAACTDWSEFQGDLYGLAVEDGQGEERGFTLGILDAGLTSAARKALPDSAFCGPNRSFPVNDKAHVRNALARLPQVSIFDSAQKAKILASVLRRAKSMGVTITADQLEFDAVSKLHDSKAQSKTATPPPPPPPENETVEQKVQRLELQNTAAIAKVEDMQAQNSRLIDELTDVRGELHRHLAQQVFDMRLLLKKPDVVALSTEDTKQEFIAKLKLRKTESLRDSLIDLSAEIDASQTAKPGQKTPDPTAAGLRDNLNQAGADSGDAAPAKAGAPSELEKLSSRLRGK